MSAAIAYGLVSSAIVERRTDHHADLERERVRLKRERERLDEEPKPSAFDDAEEALELRLCEIERQLREVLAERDRWLRGALRDRRRRREDFRLQQRLKEEHERLTGELIRCATALCGEHKSYVSYLDPRMRRVWRMLRLSGT